MVNQLSGYNSAYVTDAMKYLQHMAVVEHKSDLGQDIKSSLTMAPILAIPSALSAKGDFYSANAIMGTTAKAAEKKGIFKKLADFPKSFWGTATGTYGNVKSGNAWADMKNAFKNHETLQTMQDVNAAIVKTNGKIEKLSKAKDAAKNADKIADATKALDNLKDAKKSLDAAYKAGSKADDVLKTADSALDAARAANKGFFSKIGSTASKPFAWAGKKIAGTGAYKAIAASEKGASALTKLGKIGKMARRGGAIFDLIVEGGMQLFTEVIPAFKNGGIGSGVKQIGKSGLQVAGSVGGWIGGAKAGAVLGGALGSAVPVIGNVVGAAIGGIVGGLLGSSLLSGVAKKITGKSENEKIAEEQTQQQAQLIAQDSASVQQLQSAVAQQVQYDIQTGNVTEDTQKMMQYLAFNPTYANQSVMGPSFGSLTTQSNVNNTAADNTTGAAQSAKTAQSFSIATNLDGSYDFSVPQNQQISTASTNPYGMYQDPILG